MTAYDIIGIIGGTLLVGAVLYTAFRLARSTPNTSHK